MAESTPLQKRTTCPRCGSRFVCRSDEISACHCSKVVLDRELGEAIAQRYQGCLCATCLATLAQSAALEQQ